MRRAGSSASPRRQSAHGGTSFQPGTEHQRVRRRFARALQVMHEHFAPDLPDCSLALLLVRGQAEGRCRLAGLIGPDGTEHVPNLDPNGERIALPLFDDRDCPAPRLDARTARADDRTGTARPAPGAGTVRAGLGAGQCRWQTAGN